MLFYIVVLSLIIIFVFFCLHLWFKRKFEESDARKIPSLVEHLSVKTLLVTLAHPDDEIFIAGLLEDAAAREDVCVHAVTVTQGRGGTSFGEKEEGTSLAAQRCKELSEHYALLGVENYEILDFTDGDLIEEIDDLTLAMTQIISQVEPDTVLTFDPRSGYTGHPDHSAIGDATLMAVDRVNNINLEKNHSARVKNIVHFLVPRLAIGHFGGQRGKVVAEKQVPVQFAVKVDPVLKTRGWKIHVSQSSYLWNVYKITPWVLYRYFDHEYFFVRSTK